MAESTKKTRLGQWGIYKRVCRGFGWPILPCDVSQACLYVSYLAQRLKISTVKAYYQAVIFHHVCAGLEPVRMSNPVLKATLKGIENCKSEDSKGKDPILPHHLRRIMSIVDMSNELEVLVSIACLFMFRTLLRVSNIVHSNHTLRVCDVKVSPQGCIVNVRSSKTTSTRDVPVSLPLAFSKDSNICAATWLLFMVKRFRPSSVSPLFSSPSVPKLTYSMFAKKFKDLVSRAGLEGDYASHSLRRGGATFMSMLERPIDQIKARGMWRSDCVYRYIVPPMSAKLSSEEYVAQFC